MENTEEYQWYYEEKGTRIGPVSKTKIAELIQANVINYDTQVWRNGFQDWKKITETELQNLVNRMGPPPLTGNKVNNFFILGFGVRANYWRVPEINYHRF